MNIITYFYKFLEKNFNDYLKSYFSENNFLYKSSDFNNYFNFITNLDKFSSSFIIDILKSYFEYIDECFFHSSYRKSFCSSKGFYERKNFVTIFGNVSFKRRCYFDKNTNEYFFFTDLFLGLPKRKHFDPLVCADLVEKSADNSYSKAGKIVADKIGLRSSINTNNSINIPRATVRNIVLGFDPIVDENIERKRIERLFIMLDEKFVGSQFNNGIDLMIKGAVVFEDTKLEYKTKRKENSTDRYRLVNSHVCANIDNDLTLNVVDYIYNNYDTEHLKELYFMGDCAKWIKSFPKSQWFKYTKDTKVYFSMDGFHFSQAINNITTTKKENENWNNALNHAVKVNNKDLFIRLCRRFIEENPIRESIIVTKEKYILNNWKERQLYQNKPFLKCSMESHISHIFADIFTSRPKAYSKEGLRKLLKIRLLKVNGYNLKEVYLKSFNKTKEKNNTKKKVKYNELYYHSNESVYDHEHKINSELYYLSEHNVIKYIKKSQINYIIQLF